MVNRAKCEKYDLSKLKILSVEIGDDCNLKHLHKKCPINHIHRSESEAKLTTADILRIIDDAVDLKFEGYIAFHQYNEPLLYIDKIEQVIKKRPDQKYLLWSNGLLIPEVEKAGYSLNMFSKMVLTCYDPQKASFYSDIKDRFPDVEIIMLKRMDDRLDVYDDTYKNPIFCKKVFFELPINCYGEVFLCCHDWKGTYLLGNVLCSSLESVVKGERYQNLLSMSHKRRINKNAPPICRRCRYAFSKYHEGDNISSLNLRYRSFADRVKLRAHRMITTVLGD